VHPYWRGYLKLSLVFCPIALHVATSSSERVSFRQISRKTGNRLRQQLVDEVTREPVHSEHRARGYEIGRGQYLLIEDEELETIEIESTRTIDIDRFVPRCQIDQRYRRQSLSGGRRRPSIFAERWPGHEHWHR
jgi:DNA end-binding protein Ku